MSERWGAVIVLWTVLMTGSPALGEVVVGMLIDGPWEQNDEITRTFEQEVVDLTGREFDVTFPESKRVIGDWTVGGVSRGLDGLLADPEVDIVITAGVLGSNEAGHRGVFAKPVIAPFVINAQLQNIPLADGASGVRNFTYVTFPSDVLHNIQIFQTVVPFTRMAYLYTPVVIESIPELVQNLTRAVSELDIQIDFVPIQGDVSAAVQAIPDAVEAVYVLPLLGLDEAQTDRAIQALIERKLPTFSVVGTNEVERGMLVGTAPDFNIPKLGRRVAINVQRILLGEDPSTFRVLFTRGERLTINMTTARRIGVYPPWAVLTDATLIDPQRKIADRSISLGDAVREAIDANLDLRAAEAAVSAGEGDVYGARSRLLPQAQVSVTGAVIDGDAGSSFQAEKQVTGALSASQVIFSEKAFANVSIQKRLQAGREYQRDEVRLDVVREAAVAYLNVLRGKTFERIQRENLRVSRQNLELAMVRRDIGASGPAEVYRWESQIATDQRRVIEANVQRNLAEMGLNRVLRRPLEESFRVEEIGLDDPRLMTRHERFHRFIDNPWRFRVLRMFLVNEGLANAPELKQLAEAVGVQDRLVTSARSSFFSPTIGAEGEVSRILHRSGAGTQAPAVGGDATWQVGVSASLPLFEGGARFSGWRQAQDELAKLRFEEKAARDRIEQRIRSSLHTMGGSFASIKLSQSAAAAARKNLELTVDAYSRGVVAILALLDAQNAALVAEQASANAVYDFLADLMEVERSVGSFSFFLSDGEMDELLNRLEAFFRESEGS